MHQICIISWVLFRNRADRISAGVLGCLELKELFFHDLNPGYLKFHPIAL